MCKSPATPQKTTKIQLHALFIAHTYCNILYTSIIIKYNFNYVVIIIVFIHIMQVGAARGAIVLKAKKELIISSCSTLMLVEGTSVHGPHQHKRIMVLFP